METAVGSHRSIFPALRSSSNSLLSRAGAMGRPCRKVDPPKSRLPWICPCFGGFADRKPATQRYDRLCLSNRCPSDRSFDPVAPKGTRAQWQTTLCNKSPQERAKLATSPASAAKPPTSTVRSPMVIIMVPAFIERIVTVLGADG